MKQRNNRIDKHIEHWKTQGEEQALRVEAARGWRTKLIEHSGIEVDANGAVAEAGYTPNERWGPRRDPQRRVRMRTG